VYDRRVFVGHFAVGFGARRLAPRPSLAVLLAAPQFLDMLWPVGVALGLERVRIVPGLTAASPLALDHYPYSHSLAATVVWSLLFGAVYAALTKDRRGAVVLAGCVASHWVLDIVAHIPDVPLWPGGEARLGLGLWRSIPGTLLVECGMLAAGVWLFVRASGPRSRAASIGLFALVATLVLLYLGAIFGPPPPSVGVLVGSAFGGWGLLLWAWAVDRRREIRPAT